MRLRRPGLGQLPSHLRFSSWPALVARPRRLGTASAAAALVLALIGVAVAGVFTGTSAQTAAAAAGRPSIRSARPAAGGRRAGLTDPAGHRNDAGGQGRPGPVGKPASKPAGRPDRTPAKPASRTTAQAPAAAGRRGRRGRPTSRSSGPSKTAAAPAPRPVAGTRSRLLRTTCRSVAHIGDSTSVGLISPEYLPDPAQRLPARYADVGVRHLWVDASGGRSIVEELPGQVNGYNVAAAWRSEGYRGCWVLALGTNDTANVTVGSAVGRLARIERMMSVARGEPVLWVNVRTLLANGPWAESNMQIWNDTLRQACAIYPNMRIFDWSSVANPGWYISDGIHYTSAGYAARARAIADALARAFRPGGASSHCVVR